MLRVRGTHVGLFAAGQQRGLVNDVGQLCTGEAACDLRQRAAGTGPVQLRRLSQTIYCCHLEDHVQAIQTCDSTEQQRLFCR